MTARAPPPNPVAMSLAPMFQKISANTVIVQKVNKHLNSLAISNNTLMAEFISYGGGVQSTAILTLLLKEPHLFRYL